MDKEKLKLIIFDMDGVILNSEPLHEIARQRIYRKFGIIPDERFPNPVGNSASGFWGEVLKFRGLTGDPYELEAMQYALVSEQIEERRLKPSEGLIDVIEWAKDTGVTVGLASSSSRALVDDVLRLLHIGKYFDYTVSGDEVRKRKPEPDVYLRVLELAHVPPSEAAAVEDTGTGVTAAHRAGLFCYGYNNVTSGAQKLKEAERIIGRLSEIIC